LKFDLLEIYNGLKFKSDIFLSHGSPYAAHASFFLRKPNIALEDTGNREQVKLYLPFTKTVLTSNSFHLNYGAKQIKYNGFHELAYLHPNYFKQNPDILYELGIGKDEVFFFVRFISWDASHDKGQNGLKWEEKLDIINFLNSKGKVIISSEKELPNELKKFSYKLHPSKAHDVMSYATLFIGEGATMASESAILGTPAIYINSMEAGTINEQEKYGLVNHFRNGDGVLEKVKELNSV
jgi:predicted glycosyltransferase